MKKTAVLAAVFTAICFLAGTRNWADDGKFNGLGMGLDNLYRVSDAKTRSISPENFTGEKGKGGMADLTDKDKPHAAVNTDAARELGRGWKVNPYVNIAPKEIF